MDIYVAGYYGNKTPYLDSLSQSSFSRDTTDFSLETTDFSLAASMVNNTLFIIKFKRIIGAVNIFVH